MNYNSHVSEANLKTFANLQFKLVYTFLLFYMGIKETILIQASATWVDIKVMNVIHCN